MNSVNDDDIRRLYLEERRSMKEVAEILGVSAGYVHKKIHQLNITPRKASDSPKSVIGKPLRTEHKEKLIEANRGKVLSKETKQKMSASKIKGGIGHKKRRKDGYIAIYFPDHPQSNEDGYIMEHILVMEALIGRHLTENECVHHKNFNRADNRKDNLQLMTKSEHMSYHSTLRHQKRGNDLSIQ